MVVSVQTEKRATRESPTGGSRPRQKPLKAFPPTNTSLAGSTKTLGNVLSDVLAQVEGILGAGVEKGLIPAPLERIEARFTAQVPHTKSHLRQKDKGPAPRNGAKRLSLQANGGFCRRVPPPRGGIKTCGLSFLLASEI